MARLRHAAILAMLIAPLAPAGGYGAEAEAPVALKPSPALGRGMAAFPRIAGEHPAAQRINKALAALDKRFRAAAAECKANDASNDATRTIEVALQGARYLSVVAYDEWFCGGAHPSSDSVALTYDLKSGAPVNWQKLLPAALAEKAVTDSVFDGTVIGMIASKKLSQLYLKEARQAAGYDPGCIGVLAEYEDLAFQVWPAAKEGGIAIQPANLPHAVAACGDSVVISAGTMRALGADAGLLADIDGSRAAGRQE